MYERWPFGRNENGKNGDPCEFCKEPQNWNLYGICMQSRRLTGIGVK